MNVEEIFRKYGDMLYRVALVMLKNVQDAEDAVSDTLVKYMVNKKEFRDDEHRKAWLIRVIINLCKNRLLFRARHPGITLEALNLQQPDERSELLQSLMDLPPNYREVLLLYYVQGYKIAEIADILRIGEGAVKKRLERGRKKLKEQVERDGGL